QSPEFLKILAVTIDTEYKAPDVVAAVSADGKYDKHKACKKQISVFLHSGPPYEADSFGKMAIA
ncbi:MAG: hypothetical protein M0Q19_08760, partial [Candidatus Cloacimonetes bacterium]|nr:hypothetical protein [Candidatus Cloacimonadota bacterium]